jgi:hypothetical protein
MTIATSLQQLKDWLDENPWNLSSIELDRILEKYEKMKKKYNV